MQKRRLLKLAKFLYQLPPERFDYGTWVGDDWEGKKDLSCGTKAGALGWATTIPSFEKLGLRLVKPKWANSDPYITIGDKRRFANNNADDGGYRRSIRSAHELFGISEEEAEYLFNPTARPGSGSHFDDTPQQVAAHIRRFVKRRTNAFVKRRANA